MKSNTLYSQEHSSRVGSFLFGFTLPLRSLKIILSKPKLLFLASLPILVTVALYWFFFQEVQIHLQPWMNSLLQRWGLESEGKVAGGLFLLIKGLLLVLSALTFSLLAGIAAVPVNDFLAEATESYSNPPLKPVPGQSIRMRIKIVGIDVMKSAFAIAIQLLTLLISWVPLINFAAALLAFLLVCFQYISYPQTRRGQGVSSGARFLRSHFFACVGFGAASTFLFAIPFLSGLFIPIAVVGGTLLFARGSQESQLPRLR